MQGIPYLNLPDVCTENPKHGQAFCATHCQFLKDNAPGVPTGLREFLRHCGLNSNGQGWFASNHLCTYSTENKMAVSN